MSMLSKPSFGPRVSLIYVTAGSLLDVWIAVYYFFEVRGNPNVSQNTYFWLSGLFLTGLALIFLGLIIGPLGQHARKAELPPAEAINREQTVQQTAPVANAAVPGTAAPAAPPVASPVAPPGYAAPAAPPVAPYAAPAVRPV